jgi:glutaredoxin 3
MAGLLLKQLADVHGIALENIPTPTAVYFQDWGQDPFGGGYHGWASHYNICQVMDHIRARHTRKCWKAIAAAKSTSWARAIRLIRRGSKGPFAPPSRCCRSSPACCRSQISETTNWYARLEDRKLFIAEAPFAKFLANVTWSSRLVARAHILKSGAVVQRIEIYTARQCPYCASAKAILKRKELAFTEFDIAGNWELRDEMMERAHGNATVPQIFIGSTHIGGCAELQELDRSNRLDTLVSA